MPCSSVLQSARRRPADLCSLLLLSYRFDQVWLIFIVRQFDGQPIE